MDKGASAKENWSSTTGTLKKKLKKFPLSVSLSGSAVFLDLLGGQWSVVFNPAVLAVALKSQICSV